MILELDLGNTRGKSSKLWTLYLRIYELLWGMERGSLCGPDLPERPAAGSDRGPALLRLVGDERFRREHHGTDRGCVLEC